MKISASLRISILKLILIVLVADSSKFDKVSISYFAGLDEVHTVITDDGICENYRKILKQYDIELIIAK